MKEAENVNRNLPSDHRTSWYKACVEHARGYAVVLAMQRETRPHGVPRKPTAARVPRQTQMQGVRSQTADRGLAQRGKRDRPANKAHQSARFPLKLQVDNCKANGLSKAAVHCRKILASEPGVFADRRQVERHGMTIFSCVPGRTQGPQRLELCGQMCSK